VQPVPPTTNQTSTPAAAPRSSSDLTSMRSSEFRPRRALWPGLLGAAIIGAGVGALLISNYYDDRTLGARVDATVVAAEARVQDGVDDLRNAASGAAQGSAEAADRVAGSVGDTAITAAVKTALVADPSLSALSIDVTTTQGSVRLDGPAPDAKSRQRAEVLAAAPQGVIAVDNRLVVATARAPTAAPAPLPATPAAPAKQTPVTPPVVEAGQPVEPPAATETRPVPTPSGSGTPAQ
jgi:hyperosmotically inducible protein